MFETVRARSRPPARRPGLAAALSAPLMLFLSAWCLAATTRPADTSARGSDHAPAREEARVLFIGNSLTYVNDLPAQVQAMAKEAYPDGPAVRCEQVTVGGATLRSHWEEGKALARIRAGGWDYVVLQEQSQTPILNRAQMFEYAKRFDPEIRKAGAKTILYMTWPNRQRPEDLKALADAYTTLGKDMDAIVVPAGEAWREAATADGEKPGPAPMLYAADGVHPAPAGTWLAACCFVEKLWGEPHKPLPRRITGAGSGAGVLVDVTGSQAAVLEAAARRSISDSAAPAPTTAPAGR